MPRGDGQRRVDLAVQVGGFRCRERQLIGAHQLTFFAVDAVVGLVGRGADVGIGVDAGRRRLDGDGLAGLLRPGQVSGTVADPGAHGRAEVNVCTRRLQQIPGQAVFDLGVAGQGGIVGQGAVVEPALRRRCLACRHHGWIVDAHVAGVEVGPDLRGVFCLADDLPVARQVVPAAAHGDAGVGQRLVPGPQLAAQEGVGAGAVAGVAFLPVQAQRVRRRRRIAFLHAEAVVAGADGDGLVRRQGRQANPDGVFAGVDGGDGCARRQLEDAAADRAADLACGRLADIVVFRQRGEG